MFAVVSPAKSLNLDPASAEVPSTSPVLLEEAERLAKTCRNLPQKKLREMMSISKDLAKLNRERFQAFEVPFAGGNHAKQAALMFNGDVYRGLSASTLSADDLDWAQGHFGILSGLYGLLRPLDLIQPYRLEMGTTLKTRRGTNLYKWWGDRVTKAINTVTEDHADRTVVNLASQEYWGVVTPKKLKGGFITCDFREVRDGEARIISFFAKQARGAMARYIIEERIDSPEGLKGFDRDGYAFDAARSTADTLQFLRDSG
jgi:uncharacterized protein